MDISTIPRAVIRCYAEDYQLAEDIAERHFAELAKFLKMSATSDGSCAPSRQIDKAWHIFLLFTREYQEFCQGEIGSFVHHAPSERKLILQYEKSRRLLRETYGSIDEELWPANSAEAAS